METVATILSLLAVGALCITIYVVIASLRPRARLVNFYLERMPSNLFGRRPTLRSLRDRRQVQTSQFPVLSEGLVVYHERRSRGERRGRGNLDHKR
jgi:hypothetical protein